MHELALEQARGMTIELRTLLDAAVAAGELAPGIDTARMAIAVQSLQSGSLMNWAILREGTARRFVRRDLEMLIEPYRRKTGARTNRRRR
jgi:hypothetical protein